MLKKDENPRISVILGNTLKINLGIGKILRNFNFPKKGK